MLCIFLIVIGAWIFSAVVKSAASGGVQFGGLGKAYELFGDRLEIILEELNQRLAA